MLDEKIMNSDTLLNYLEKIESAYKITEQALKTIRDLDFEITLPDRMEAVRKISRDALEKARVERIGPC